MLPSDENFVNVQVWAFSSLIHQTDLRNVLGCGPRGTDSSISTVLMLVFPDGFTKMLITAHEKNVS